ncbi:hypothetical protein D9757_008924 [Collybiopsis confluens]|uniref:Mitochondrial import inner membrane translocase subunit TIM54 n=1 Tax=Collybiopsis confluens TaxID=2823264 RepID=A0A8H5HFG3_9AGAR|nr:hypothetical protein D9757_008924 [Collybiopsis confluens]
MSKKSGLASALQYTGIPPSLLSKRPSLPSRNWLIFLGLTSSLISAYVYDRTECRRLKELYIQSVKAEGEGFSWIHGGEAGKDAHLAWPRKLTVYGAKWPGDEDYDQPMKYFRRYIKPIFVAAAIDYDMVTGKLHGDIANRSNMPPAYYSPSQLSREALALASGTVIIGRATLKEYLSGVARGYNEPYLVNGRKNWGDEAREEKVRQSLSDDVFDLDEPSASQADTPAVIYSRSSSTPIPPLPPLLLVPFTNYLGFVQIPYMLLDFFYKRRHVREGGEAALKAVWGVTRGWEGPENANTQSVPPAPPPPQGGDLDFALETESYYRSYLFSPLSSPSPSEKSPIGSTQKARDRYYAELPARLWVAREFNRRGDSFEDDLHSSPSVAEIKPEWKAAWDKAKSSFYSDANKPPLSEVELRLERFEKEKKWSALEKGWDVVRPERGCLWDRSLGRQEVVKVFIDGGV